jgi:diacylglycerol kinase (ATP)
VVRQPVGSLRLGLVANAAAGSGTEPQRVAELLREAGARVSVHAFAPSPDHQGLDEADRAHRAISDAAAQAVASAPDRLVVAGGDGSIGPVAAQAARAGLPLAVVPIGTANDFARALDLPRELRAACALAATGSRERSIDLVRAGDRPFVNAASVGLSVMAARQAGPLKRALGAVAYAVGAVRAGATAAPLRCRVVADGEELFAGEAWQVIVAGTGAFGGGSELDVADASDRLLDVAVLEAGSRAALVRRAWGMRNGGLTRQRGVRHARAAVAEVDVASRPSFNVDGEICSVAPPRFCASGERVRVVCP